jgi:molybdopterin/thiamine biosynthesis adenylyltransferase/rhodanese-related sulfurtransferase
MTDLAARPADLAPADLRRYARQIVLPQVGGEGQARLKAARVLVVGAGGLGSPALLYLAAAGVGTVGVVDADRVELSNLQRQVIHHDDAVGRSKVASAAATLAGVNPHVTVETHELRVDAANALDVVRGYDLVLDGSDNFPTRYAVNDACTLLGIPDVWGSVHQFEGQCAVWWAPHGPCYRCVFPRPPAPGLMPSCEQAGVLGAVCAAVAAAQVMEALKILCGIGRPAVGRMLVHDALSASWETLEVERRADCELCGDAPTMTAPRDETASCAVPTPDGAAPVELVTAVELASLLRDGDRPVRLVDVRGPGERSIVAIPGAEAIGLEEFTAGRALDLLAPEDDVVLYCKSGRRSATAAGHVPAGRVRRVRSLDGGVLAWVRDVDPRLPSY